MVAAEPDRPVHDNVQEVHMAARRCSEKGKEKQLEKELPWERIPPSERPDYVEAEKKQWREHAPAGF